MADALPWTPLPDGVRLQVRLTPKSSRDEVDGFAALSDGRPILKARVRAIPEDGAANKALTELLAKTLGTPKSSVEVEGGKKDRLKTVKIQGDAKALGAALEKLPGLD